jgi:hypothetical protein
MSLGKSLGAFAAVAAAATVAVSPAQGATFTVTTPDDSGPGSLRQAILDANGSPGADTIDFGVSGIVTLTSGELLVADTLIIAGPGAASLTISGSNASRVLKVASGASLNLDGVTIADGTAPGEWPANFGGGIRSDGTLVVTNSAFTGNSAPAGGEGGAIHNGGSLTVADSIFSGNSASYGGGINSLFASSAVVTNSTFMENVVGIGGGGIRSDGGGPLTVTDSTFSGNSADSGAGVAAGGGMLTISDSTFTDNDARTGSGGGLAACPTTGTVTGSTFSGNTGVAAGAVAAGCGDLTILNSTLTGNSAGFFGGGAIRADSATLTLTNTTISGTAASGTDGTSGLGGGAIFNFDDGAVIVLRNMLLANNTAWNGSCVGATSDGGANLSWPDSGCPGINRDPLLDPAGLQDNGGPTQTIALQPGSPAIDAAVVANCPATDQRGVARPQGAGCDIGAFELDVIPIAIDIRPGSESNRINLSSRGAVPVAVLGTPTFDAAEVDPDSACFGDAEAPDERDCEPEGGGSLEDVNADGIDDLVLRFRTRETGIDPGDTVACLTGSLFGGTSIEGCDSIETS